MTDRKFVELFESYMRSKRDDMRERFDRVLPSGEYIFNRFDKATYLNAGSNSSVYDTSVIMGDVEIGENVWIGPYTLLEGINGKLKIGNWVSIDAGVMIYTHDSTRTYVSGGVDSAMKGDVLIGDCTVIGSQSIIGCGVTIGNHCVVGAHSFVNKDIPDGYIAAGTPARLIGEVVINDDQTVKFNYF